ncbi:MAG TPA: ABC transporter permease, partial [Terracidiphilus sp.]|nr:ABC transporter permease [Terracidiphilus sp.]
GMRALWIRLIGWLRPGRGEEEFVAEIETHVFMDIEAGSRAGLNQVEARRQALIRLGGIEQTRQAYRDRRGLPWLEDLVNDLRYSARMASRNPAFACVGVLTLAVGIGACATAFTWIDAVLLQPLSGVADPTRLVTIETVTSNGEWVPNSYPDFIDFRDHLKQFDGIAVSHPSAFSVGQEDHGDRIWGELVSGNFFSVLGVQPEAGRLFLPSEYGDAPGAYSVAVISDRYWRAHYDADPAIAGKTIRINQHEFTIVGVTPPAFHGSIPITAFDVWVPYMEQAVLNGVQGWMLRDRHDRNMLGIARLKQGVTFEQANAELKALAERMAVANADVSEGMSAILLPIAKSPHGPQGLLAGPLRILMGVCALLLLIVCANVANLLLARATVREKEFSARMALGARRGRIARQVLTESLMLTAVGAGLGLAVTPWLAHALKFLMPSGTLQLLVAMDTRPNLAVLVFTAGICVIAALAAGMVPALQVGRINLSARLNANGRSGTAGRGRNRLRSTLVAVEVALALVAMVSAGLLTRGFKQTMRIDPGFDPDHVLVNQFYLSTNGYNLVQRKEFCRRLEERMTAAQGVTDIAYSDGIALGFEPSWWEELKIEGYAPRPNENMNIFRNVVSPGYLPLMHIPMVEGRNFTDQDNENAPDVMIVNEAFVRRFFAGRDPIGHRIHGWGKWFRVVGVAKDSKYHYLSETAPAYFYVPFRQVFREDMNLAFYVRAPSNPEALLTTLRAQVKAIDPNVTVYDAVPLKEFIGASLYPQKVAASLMAVLGSLSLLLAAVGLYSVMAYSVAQRTQEIGVRMALGAQPAHVLRMVVRQGLALVVIGLVLGAVFAVGMERAVSFVSFTNSAMGVTNQLLRANASDALVYVAAAVVLTAVAALAAYIPARRAARTDPMQALRTE